MSIRVISRVWPEAGNIKPPQLLVLLALADWANDKGECWPKVGSIAKKTGLTRRTITSILGKLEAMGYLQIDHRRGKGQANYYTLMVPPQPVQADWRPELPLDLAHDKKRKDGTQDGEAGNRQPVGLWEHGKWEDDDTFSGRENRKRLPIYTEQNGKDTTLKWEDDDTKMGNSQARTGREPSLTVINRHIDSVEDSVSDFSSSFRGYERSPQGGKPLLPGSDESGPGDARQTPAQYSKCRVSTCNQPVADTRTGDARYCPDHGNPNSGYLVRK
ncbi:MAG: helix-turn-helix domain-containing protein [Chloroflexia bacterium]